jgi:hypothetical protein
MGCPDSIPIPQIYRIDGVRAEQWVMISRWGITHDELKIDFDGPLSEKAACDQKPEDCDFEPQGPSGSDTNNSPIMAWSQMVDAM